nr:hypothetical protein JG1_0070 [uncultured bacterium]
MNKPMPIPLSMIVCDTIIEDKKTNKKSLIGMFSNVATGQVPCVLPRFGIFISLTEGIGHYDCMVKCLRSNDNSLIGQTLGAVDFNDRRQVVEIALDITGLAIPQYGDYRFEFYCDQELLISRKFSVSLPASQSNA